MRIVIQRSKNSSVKVKEEVVGKINNGFVILVGFTENDTIEDIKYLVKKVVNLRVFDDEKGIMNKSILEVGGSILSISQFTLYADTKKGNRPSYIHALNGSLANPLYHLWNEELRSFVPVETGIFGEDMEVSIINDGPITIVMDSKER